MAKIARVTQLIFAASAVNNGVFGSAQANAGPGTISSSVATIQGLAAWGAGWLSATIGSSKFPCLEEFQGVDFVITSQLAYLFQQGIPEYDAGTTYFIDSVCMQPGTLNLYASLTNSNVGNALSSGSNWQLLGSLANLANAVAPVQGEAKNLKIVTTSNTASTITADALILKNASGNAVQVNTVNNSYSTAASGANGLDTGSLAASTWYNEFIIYNGTTVASLLSLSATAPTLPSGYTYFARVGAIRVDASSHIIYKLQYGRSVQVVYGTNPAAQSNYTMASGSGTLTVAVGNFVPSTASEIKAVLTYNDTGTGGVTMALGPNSVISFVNVGSAGSTLIDISTPVQMILESTNIYYSSNTSSGVLFCTGWIDNL